MATDTQETVPVSEEMPAEPKKKASSAKVNAAASSGTPGKKKKKKKHGKKKNQPGKYSLLVIDIIRRLAERNGSSLVKIYNEAKKVGWFDQQNGRTYLRYSIKALLLNDSLIQVKGSGANGSFKLNKKKFEKPTVKKSAPKSSRDASGATKAKKPSEKKPKHKAGAKKKPEAPKGAAKKAAVKPKKAVKKSTAAKKVKPKSSKPSVPKVPKAKKAAKK